MTKQEFIDELKLKLSGFSECDIDERINFYSEMIEDMIEEGSTEEDAVFSIGSVDDIASQIIVDISVSKNDSPKVKSKRKLKGGEIALLIAGSPLWIVLGIVAFAVIISLYAVLWSLVVSAWAVFASFVGSAIGSVIFGILFICTGNALSGVATIGAGLTLAGLSIFTFIGCLAATKGSAKLSKMCVIGIKNVFSKKESV